MYRARLLYWINVAAISVLLLVSDDKLHQLAGVVILLLAPLLLRVIQNAAERHGAVVALDHVWTLIINDQEDRQDGWDHQ